MPRVHALGRRAPTDDNHVRAHPFQAAAPKAVERVLELPSWHWSHDQGQNGACVGHGSVMERAIRQRYELKYLKKARLYTVRYNPWWLWDRAKEVDEWTDSNPGDDEGTSVRAAYDVLRAHGVPSVKPIASEGEYPGPSALTGLKADSAAEVSVNTWATTIDQMRASIDAYQPVTIGINWYAGFDTWEHRDGVDWIGRGPRGRLEGGHCLCIYGASDKKQAFRVKNSWGRDYPLVWLAYDAMETLLSEDGEATVATDSLL